MLISESVRKIVCAAIDNEILILTRKASIAYGIYAEIKCFMKYTIGVNVITSLYTVYTAAYKPIVACSVEQWNNKELPYNPFVQAYRGDFNGVVLVTDKSIASAVRGIAEGVKIRYLPMNSYEGMNQNADKTVENFQAKLDKIRKKYNIEV